jgi:hypothetical protein
MTTGEAIFLAVVVIVFVAYAATLAYYSRH